MQILLEDLRFGIRILIKNPTNTLVAVLALAFGIGATSTVFSIANAVLIQPLPYGQPDQLVMIWENNVKEGNPFYSVAPPNWLDFKNQSDVFEQLAAYTRTGQVNLTGLDEPILIISARVSQDCFPVLRASPILGRNFTQDEDQPGNSRVAILSYSFWQSQFAGDRNVLGRTITLDGVDYAVVGVMPRDFRFPVEVARGVVVVNDDVDVWAPLALPADAMQDRGQHFLRLIGRLKPGIESEQAATEIRTISQRLAQQYPETNKNLSVNLVPLRKQLFGRVQPALLLLLAGTAFVLLMACANVANLLLARGVARKREIAVRLCLGASRRRLVRQLLTEGALLAVAGGTVGIFLAYLAIRVLPLSSLRTIARVQDVKIDKWVLAFTLLLSLLTSIIFGLVPALKSSNISLQQALKEAVQRSAGAWLGRRTQSLLVVLEIALAFVVLIGAGLMIKSFLRILSTDPGFNPDNILIVEMKLPFSKYPEGHRIATFYQQLLERVGALPGVSSAGATSHVPFSGAIFATPFIIEGLPAQEREDEVSYRKVSSNYFTAMGIPLREGRFFTEQDVKGSLHVTLINEFAARKFWPNESPIGKRVKFSRNPKASWLTIVGVVGTIRDSGLDSEPEPEMYEHYLQNPGFLTLVARTSESPALTASAIRSEVWKLDKDIPVSQLQTMDRQLADSLSARRLNTTFFFLFAVIVCVLAYTGIYAVMSFSVTQRTHEIGIRIALGARPRDVLKLVVTEGMRLALLGTMIGIAASIALTRVLTSLLYGVSVTDRATFLFVTLLLCGIAMLGSYIPARRATRLDPATALRYE